jgi:FlaA1/EpsC-like NDP-sugar epimerase
MGPVHFQMLRLLASTPFFGKKPQRLTIPSGDDQIAYKNLLHRPQVSLDLSELKQFYKGKRILITGAGGSIGSEIAQQVAEMGATHVSLVENSELALYSIDQSLSLKARFSMTKRAILCDIRRKERLMTIVRTERPDIIFHAAALKHVPMVEQNPSEGVLTNVLGTQNLIEVANACKVAQLVMISSDKAVAPSSLMGATKRLAEHLIRHNGLKSSAYTQACVVRFGNVLGSTGSVVPLFRAQIERGGPITITDPKAERFFMTILEAVQLVLQAALQNTKSKADMPNLYVLEMGTPVKIVDLAKRMIRLYGLKAGRDIEIKFIGLRDGEKLTEDLTDIDETQAPVMPGIFEVVSQNETHVIEPEDLERLFQIASKSEDDLVRSLLFSFVNKIHRPQVNITAAAE